MIAILVCLGIGAIFVLLALLFEAYVLVVAIWSGLMLIGALVGAALWFFGFATGVWAYVVPCASFFSLAMGMACLGYYRIAVDKRRRAINACLRCGYCLIGLTSPRCPECGVIVSQADAAHSLDSLSVANRRA